MINLVLSVWPELALVAVAFVLLLLGALRRERASSLAPVLALLGLVASAGLLLTQWGSAMEDRGFTNSMLVGPLAQYVKLLTCAAGVLFVLLAWPLPGKRGETAGGNGALAVGGETAEYFALMLLSLAGLMVTAGANSLILLFIGLELASIPTYIMVAISRPLPVAQEAGLKYFFLGALSAALMLLGFSYLYGATGTIYLEGNGLVMPGIYEYFSAQAADAAATGGAAANWGGLTGMQMLAVVLLLAGFAFKMAAFPLHVYAADVYQGAATPLTAMLSVVPKLAGLVALLKVLLAVGGAEMRYPSTLVTLMAVIAVLTMTLGNVLALLQYNLKRMMAYSSVAHSGYLLAGVTAFMAAGASMAGAGGAGGAGTGAGGAGVGAAAAGMTSLAVAVSAFSAVLFYIAVYTAMNTGVFAVLQQLPARRPYGDARSDEQRMTIGAASAETLEDIAGYGKPHPVLGVYLAVCALSLVGLPATAGFIGKLLIARPLLEQGLYWLLVALMVNSAISAAYYLRMPAAMFFRPLPEGLVGRSPLATVPATSAAAVCTLATVLLGVYLPSAQWLTGVSRQAAALPALRLVTAPAKTVPAVAGPAEPMPAAMAATHAATTSDRSTAR
ncbi:MAG: NADH-quinone oxidoreductase subunit N [Tepidisphaerales bacterium]